MSQRRHILTICLVITLGLSACSQPPRNNVLPASTVVPPVQQGSLDDAQRVAADFLNAWKLGGYDAMYGMLALNSRDAFTRQDFEKFYTDAERTMTLLPDGKSYALTNAIQQNDTADIAYDMTFNTKLVGPFTDSGRMLHLINAPEGWRIAWSQADIFPEMKDVSL